MLAKRTHRPNKTANRLHCSSFAVYSICGVSKNSYLCSRIASNGVRTYCSHSSRNHHLVSITGYKHTMALCETTRFVCWFVVNLGCTAMLRVFCCVGVVLCWYKGSNTALIPHGDYEQIFESVPAGVIDPCCIQLPAKAKHASSTTKPNTQYQQAILASR